MFCLFQCFDVVGWLGNAGTASCEETTSCAAAAIEEILAGYSLFIIGTKTSIQKFG